MMPEPSRTHRRQFLQGHSAREALGEWADRLVLGEVPADAAQADPPYLMRYGRRAMACQFEVLLPAEAGDTAHEAALAALDRVDALEEQLSVYRDSSELSAINRLAASRAVEVESGLFGLLARACDWAKETGGALDVTCGRLTRAWGFFDRAGRVPAPVALEEARRASGWQRIELDADRRSIRYAVPNLEINLGAIGKGYALDQAAELLLAGGVEHFFLHGGQSSVLARGSRQPRLEEGWSVGVLDPLRPGRRLAEFRLRDRALGTSGSGTQFFRQGGRRYSHLIDPRNGWPAEGVWSATVLAPTAETADALATAAFILGEEGARELCGRHPEIGLVMVVPDSSAGIRIVIENVGDDELRLSP